MKPKKRENAFRKKDLDTHMAFGCMRYEMDYQAMITALSMIDKDLVDLCEEPKKHEQKPPVNILDGLTDPRAKEAIVFAQKMGEVFKRYPDYAEQISYAVWAYLGGSGKPGSEEAE